MWRRRAFPYTPGMRSAAVAIVFLAGCCAQHKEVQSGDAVAATTVPGATTPPAAEVHEFSFRALPAHRQVLSGPLPIDADFDTLAAHGVKTIISVDAGAPDIEAAASRGMRYVHIPVGYHGIARSQQLALARAVRDLPGPVYIHCHHGKHRGPAAAASAMVLLGDLTPQQAEAFLKEAGTSPNYPGLYACVNEASVAHPADISAVPDAALAPLAPVPGFARGMSEVETRFDHLKQIERAGWVAPLDHPDLVPAAEAGRLADLFRILHQDRVVAAYPADFAEKMVKGANLASSIETLLDAPLTEASRAELDRHMVDLAADCKACHVAHRDTRDW